MSVIIPENELPQELSREQSVEIAYSDVLADTASNLQRGLPVLIECEKDLAPFVFTNIRGRLKQNEIRCLYLDGRVPPDQQNAMNSGLVGMMISQLRDAVRGAIERRVVVLPHLDLLVTGQGGLTAEAREVIPLLYENPELVWLGFKDPSFPLPQVIENLFPKRYGMLGIPRPKLKQMVTQKEARKFGREFKPVGFVQIRFGYECGPTAQTAFYFGRRKIIRPTPLAPTTKFEMRLLAATSKCR